MALPLISPFVSRRFQSWKTETRLQGKCFSSSLHYASKFISAASSIQQSIFSCFPCYLENVW